MQRSKKGKAVYTQVGVWREKDGSIHLTLKGVKNGHVAVNAAPSKRNGHPTLFARLDQLLRDVPKTPDEVQVVFVGPNGKKSAGPVIKLQNSY